MAVTKTGVLLWSAVGLFIVFECVDMGFSIAAAVTRTTTGFTVPSRPVGFSCPAGEARREAAYHQRELRAYTDFLQPVPCHVNNGDEALYPTTHIGSFSKGLVHDSLGQVTPGSYASMITALQSGLPHDFQSIQLGGTRKLDNPESGLAFALTGADAQSFAQPPAPTLASAWFAGELVENYWMALARDVNFDQYGAEPITTMAITDIGLLTDWRGPTPSASTLFRGDAPGVALGPWISQFLYLNCTMGANTIDLRIRPYAPNTDYMTTWNSYLSIQNGGSYPPVAYPPTPALRYIINGRDMARFCHMDVLFQAYLQAAMVLMELNVPFKSSIPYQSLPSGMTEAGFGTFGFPHFVHSVLEPSVYALRTVWYQKWFVHRKLRPEAGAARVHQRKTGGAAYDISTDVLNSNAVAAVFTLFGTYLLPQAFPEGSPMHPSYGAGHATVAGACATMLKFWFDESYVIPSPVQPSADGSTLNAYTGSDVLTVGGELNKLASNVAYGRNIAGVHWRSDAVESLKLGEQLAVSFLRDQRPLYNEVVPPWTATAFDGTPLSVS